MQLHIKCIRNVSPAKQVFCFSFLTSHHRTKGVGSFSREFHVHPNCREKRPEYDAFLWQKVEAGRESLRANLGTTNVAVEAGFVVMRERARATERKGLPRQYIPNIQL